MSRSLLISHSTVWLATGMLVGLALALFGILKTPLSEHGLAPNVAAQAAGTNISRDEYQRAVNAVEADRRSSLSATERRYILDRLINETLLIQHGLDLDLVRQAPRLRDQLMDAVLTGLRVEAEAKSFGESEVQAFYKQHSALFLGPDLLHVGVIRAPDKPTADAAITALESGHTFASVSDEYAGGQSILPDTFLPPAKLRDYLGPDLTRRAQAMDVGASAGPFASQNGFAVLSVFDRRAAEQPPLAEVETTVRQHIRRLAAEQLMRSRLEDLRTRYPVSVADDLE